MARAFRAEVIHWPLMNPEEIEAIVGGYHGDPFRLLGPHVVRSRRGAPAKWEVRAFLPQAAEAAVLIGDKTWPMEKQHDGGFFCAVLAGSPERYRIQAKLWDGPTIDFEDPYRFPSLISDFDSFSICPPEKRAS